MSWEIDQGEANVVLADNAFPANLFFQRLPLRQVFRMLWIRNQIPDFHLALVTLALALHHLHSPWGALVLLSRACACHAHKCRCTWTTELDANAQAVTQCVGWFVL